MDTPAETIEKHNHSVMSTSLNTIRSNLTRNCPGEGFAPIGTAIGNVGRNH